MCLLQLINTTLKHSGPGAAVSAQIIDEKESDLLFPQEMKD